MAGELLAYNAVKDHAATLTMPLSRQKLMVRFSTKSLFYALCAAAALNVSIAAADVSERQLLSGTAIFSAPIDISTIKDPGVLETDEAMRAFVAKHVRGAKSGREKTRRLLAGMIESGLLTLDYKQVETKTAKQTFYDRVGNCISFTNLFVALGREAGLNVVYQTVDIPPLWYSESDLVILNNHINALIRTKFGERVSVDFNIAEFKGNYESQIVSDNHAFALYHNNLAMDALTKGDIEGSFRYLKKSISLDPNVAGPWINLGVLYSRQNLPDYALAAYKLGLDMDPDNRSGLTNIAHLYRNMGKIGKANRYSKRIQAYQRRNPYFHYSRARVAYDNGELDEASQYLKRAIRLKKTEHQFYSLMGRISFETGDREEAFANFVKARELAGFASVQQSYDQKLALLAESAQP